MRAERTYASICHKLHDDRYPTIFKVIKFLVMVVPRQLLAHRSTMSLLLQAECWECLYF